MTEDEFWQQIASVNKDALVEEDEESAVEPLVEILSQLDAAEIGDFQERLAAALFRLDGRQYAAEAGDSGTSDDGFLYARCFVVGCGRQKYEATLKNPKLMPKSLDWFETLLSAAPRAWSRVTGQPEEEWNYSTKVSFESGRNEDAWR